MPTEKPYGKWLDRYKDKDRRIKYMHDYMQKYHENLRLKLIELLGGRCQLLLEGGCRSEGGCADIRCLQFDHVKGGGNRQMKEMGNNYTVYAYYLRNPELAKVELQLSCANCNWIKKFENGEHKPHKTQWQKWNTIQSWNSVQSAVQAIEKRS